MLENLNSTNSEVLRENPKKHVVLEDPSFARRELMELKRRGVEFSDAFEVIDLFEKRLAQFAGAKYAVTTDCSTHAIELSLRYLRATGSITIPRHTYLSIPMIAHQLDLNIDWSDQQWSGVYDLKPYSVIDASLRLRPLMHDEHMKEFGEQAFTCLSFQVKKRLPIGRGGAILTNSKEAYDWLLRASYDGRTRDKSWLKQDVEQVGFHYYMTPEDAARGYLLLDQLIQTGGHSWADLGGWANYPDLSQLKFSVQSKK